MTQPLLQQTVLARLRGLLGEARAVGLVNHQALKGHVRELLVRDLLRPFLPPSVSAEMGTIVAPNGLRIERNQDDIVVYGRELAPLMSYGGASILPLSGVLAHLEVKSTLTASDIESAARAAIELQRLADGEAPLSLLFALSSDAPIASEAGRMIEALRRINYTPAPGQSGSPVQVICVADKGTWSLCRVRDRADGWYSIKTDEDRHLLAFVSLLSDSIFSIRGSHTGLGPYLMDDGWYDGPDPAIPCVIPRE